MRTPPAPHFSTEWHLLARFLPFSLWETWRDLPEALLAFLQVLCKSCGLALRLSRVPPTEESEPGRRDFILELHDPGEPSAFEVTMSRNFSAKVLWIGDRCSSSPEIMARSPVIVKLR